MFCDHSNLLFLLASIKADDDYLILLNYNKIWLGSCTFFHADLYFFTVLAN